MANTKTIYAVETTNRMHLCQINARNCKYFTTRKKANVHAIKLCEFDWAVFNPAFDEELDHTVKVYDRDSGNAETSNALCWITRCEIN